MAINFPSSPTTGQVYEYQSIRWRWNGSAWDKYEVFTFNGLTANVEGVGSWNGLTGAVTGVTTSVANIFVPLQTFNSGISAYGASFDGGPVTVQGNIVWHAGNDGATSALDAGLLYGVQGNIYASSLSTGLLYGGLLSINAGNTATFDITAGSGLIVTTGATFTAEPNPVITRVNWTAKTGVTLSGLSSQDTTWVYVDSTGTLHQQATFFTDDQVNNTIALGALVHPTRSYISLARTIPNVSYATDKQYEQFIRSFGPLKVSGHTIQANDGNLKLNRTSGTAFILGRNYPNDPNNPSVVSDIAKTDAEIWRYYRGITAGSFVTVTGITTGIDPTLYDDGTGILHAVSPSTPFTIQRVFFFPGSPNVLGVYYGRSQYASLSEAANNIHLEDFTEITNTATNAILAAFIIVKYNVTNLDTAIAANNARIIQAGQFRTTSSGGGSVATNLDSLSDVVISGAQDDDVLIYDTATSQWLNTPLSHIGVTRFNGLTGAVTGVTTSAANTFTAIQTFNSGISAAGSTFTTIAAGNIYSNQTTPAYPIYINNLGGSQTFIGDWDGNNANTYIVVNDDNGDITISAPTSGILTYGGITDDTTFTTTNLINTSSLTPTSLNFFGGIRAQSIVPSLTNTSTITLPENSTTLTGNSLANVFTALQTFNAGITASGATFMSNINLQKGEFIRNTTDGRIDFMPGPAAANAYGLYVDATSWTYGPRLGTIRSSDNSTNVADINFETGCILSQDKAFSLNSEQTAKFIYTTTGNDTLQLCVPANSASTSSAVTLITSDAMSQVNRSPGITHTNPNLYIYSAGAANANDFIRIEHDRTNANIVTGQTSGILIQPGSGWLGVSGGISASGGVTFTGNVAMTSTSSHTGLASFAGGITASGATFTGQVTVNTFKANTVGGDEGGQIDFGLAATNTSLTGGVAIDIYQNKVRIFETGGTNRGTFIDLTGAGTGVGSDLLTRVTVAPPGFTSAINTFNDSTNNGSKTIYYLSPMYKAYANYGSYTVKANRTYFTLFSVNKPVTIKTIRSVTNSTGTTGNCYLSVYSADSTTGLPKTILYSSASLAVGSGYGGASVTNASGLVTVPAGHFYLAATYSSTPIVFGYYRYTVDGVFGSSSYSAGPFNMMPIADYTGFTAGSLPASGVTLSYLENSAGNYLGPVIDFAVV